MENEPRFCTRCKFTGVHPIEDHIAGEQWAILAILLLCFLFPGLLYAVYLSLGHGARRLYVCPSCGARRASVPLSSPVAREQSGPNFVAEGVHTSLPESRQYFRTTPKPQ
jgi:hypothetical protein